MHGTIGKMFYIIYSIIALFIVIAMSLPLASLHKKLPCPVWLGWLTELDNPFPNQPGSVRCSSFGS